MARKSKPGARRGRSAGANTIVDTPLRKATLPTGHEPHDTIVMAPRGAQGTGGGLPARGRGNLVELNKLLSEFQQTLGNARIVTETSSLIKLVTHAEKLLAVARYIAPQSWERVLRTYEKKLLPISEAMFARCGTRRLTVGP